MVAALAISVVPLAAIVVDLFSYDGERLQAEILVDVESAMLGVAISAFFIGRSLLRPFGTLSRAMTEVAGGKLDIQVPVTSNDEVGELTGQFNTMVEGLREREQIRETFGRYVDESVASTILRRQGEGTLAGETGEATILFTDIAGFTTIAEYLAPHELVAALNDYLETVLAPIRAHGGVVNTFIGDGLFASFNMPLACEEPCRRGGAGGHRHPARRRQPHLRRPGRGARHRIGISTGHVIGGSVGAGQRLSFTLLGDTVNLAARLEELNKHYGTRILVSQSTREACGDGFVFDGSAASRCAAAATRSRSSASNPTVREPVHERLRIVARPAEAAGPRPRAGGRSVTRRAAEVDRTEQYPWDNVELLKDARLIGMTIPEQYGGQGKGWLDAVLAIEALSAACAVTGRIAVETNMGAISAVMAYGSEEQKKMAADMVLAGDKPAICITEPEAGLGRQRSC